jgi:hypothetical protein
MLRVIVLMACRSVYTRQRLQIRPRNRLRMCDTWASLVHSLLSNSQNFMCTCTIFNTLKHWILLYRKMNKDGSPNPPKIIQNRFQQSISPTNLQPRLLLHQRLPRPVHLNISIIPKQKLLHHRISPLIRMSHPRRMLSQHNPISLLLRRTIM